MMRLIRFALLGLFISTHLYAYDGFGVKETGGGLSGSARALDASSIYLNPSSAGLLRSSCLSVGYSRLAWGIGGASIERAQGSYVFRRPDLGGAALSFSILNQDVSYYAKLGLTLSFSTETALFMRPLSFGVTGNWYQTGYRPSQFVGHDEGTDPIFRDATMSNAFGISAGLTANLYRDLWFGLAVRDINEPNLALQDTVGWGKRPMEIQGGFYYPVHLYFRPSVDLMWRNETINDEQVMRVRIGADARLPRGFYVRAGYDGTSIDAGLTIFMGSLFGGVDVDYAFVYPIEEELAKVGAMSHHFGMSVWGIERKPIRVDLTAKEISLEEKVHSGVDNKVIGTLTNIGKEISSGFSVTLASLDADGKWRTVYPVKFLDGAPPDSLIALDWNWKPSEPGTWTLRMTVDDDGRNLPEISGKIEEKREDNNTVMITVEATAAGGFEFEIDQTKAYVTRLEYVVEEEPLVPVIFFASGSDVIDAENQRLLKIYAERMANNPDANIVVEGFFDPSDEVECSTASALEIRRATAVRNYMISQNDALAGRISIANSLDCVLPRYRIDPSKVIRDKSLIADENRRARLWVEFPGRDTLAVEYMLQQGQTAVPAHVSIDRRIIETLEKNEDALLIIEGGFSAGEDSSLGLARAEALREKIHAENPRLLPGKVRIFPCWTGPTVRAKLTGERILWKPTLSPPSVVGWDNLEPEHAKIRITPIDFDRVKVDSSHVEIVTFDNELIRRVATTKGLPPTLVEWDWLDEGGHLIRQESVVRVRVTTYTDKRSSEYFSEGKEGRMQVRVRDTQRRIEKLLVVQFVFDEIEPTSRYLESRLDGLAHTLITQARAGLSPSVHLAGHTDAIGTETHNLQLSDRRAKRELAIFRLFIAHYLGVPTSEIDAWLADKNAVIDAAGYGETKPYTLMSLRPDGIETLLGNNNFPRGRTANRRVTVDHGADEAAMRR